ncbi:MAG TPA: hypothetical protein VED46_05630 [Alphaproteobacteria bacterium]|nr:hypothetical protein [Alphaproteobacteria bacterium]
MQFFQRDQSDRALRWVRALLSLLVGVALVLLASALFDHNNLEFDLTAVVSAAIGFYCVIRALVLFWTQ